MNDRAWEAVASRSCEEPGGDQRHEGEVRAEDPQRLRMRCEQPREAEVQQLRARRDDVMLHVRGLQISCTKEGCRECM